MKRPHSVFTVTVHPVSFVTSCPAKLAEESRGLFGFHQFDRCPNCTVSDHGWEMWGENGHLQGHASTREHLAHWLSLKARQQWRLSTPWTIKPNELQGYRFRLGARMYYRAN